MKKVLTAFALLFITTIYAQYHKGKVYFKGDSVVKGLIKVKPFSGIKFKTAENSEPLEYGYETINGYDVKGWQYRYEKKKETSTPKLFRLILDGKISIYDGSKPDLRWLIYDSTSPNKSNLFNPFTDGEIFYIKANNKLIKVINTFKKKQLEIFKDCPELLEKIEQKEFKKWDVYDIVEYYNEDCN